MNRSKKIMIIPAMFSLLISGIFPYGAVIHAEENYENESEWYEKCSQVQTSQEDVDACEAFQEYTQNKKKTLTANIDSYNAQIENLKASAEELEKLAAQQRDLVTNLNEEIASKETVISQMESSIASIQEKIDKKQAEINVWDAQIKERMKSEQSSVGVNLIVDIIMGSSSLEDMVRRLNGIERITQSDQSQVNTLNEMKAKLDFQKEELVRINTCYIEEKNNLDQQKQQAQVLESSYTKLVEEYEKNMADLAQAKREAQTDIESIKEFTIQSTIIPDIKTADGFIFPVTGGTMSAGTWAYPDGGLHTGLDWATNIGTNVVAPADGLILYANNPVESNNGFLGNWVGHPAGGGNTLEMLCNVGGTLYAVSFFHLAQDGFQVKAGDTVSQGQVLATTGNSGNSTGPHCHVEVFNLGNMSVADAVARFNETVDFAWGTGWNSTATACENNGGVTPCRERPEKYFKTN